MPPLAITYKVGSQSISSEVLQLLQRRSHTLHSAVITTVFCADSLLGLKRPITIPRHTLILMGQDWLDEIINDHPERCLAQSRLVIGERDTFDKVPLHHGLQCGNVAASHAAVELVQRHDRQRTMFRELVRRGYFKVYHYAAEISDQATGLIGWINNHGKVRVIFDNAQRELSPDRVGRVLILAYLVANLTRWTTHCIAFLRLLILQEYLQFAVLRDRGAIIAAQFWNGLSSVVSDIEPICYGTNINQKDSTRDDQPELSKGLVARIEKRWKDCDQPLYLLALLLHPFEGAFAFGPRANLDPFRIVALVVEVYIRVNSFPGNTDTPAQRKGKEQTVSKSTFEGLGENDAIGAALTRTDATLTRTDAALTH
ncbi:hypothetical protein B0H13DRAFT_2388196 [Mycena leptocephala]|nr:hypothetical protein B0H13DRAFT_2388196 [Mycena leptocephala]